MKNHDLRVYPSKEHLPRKSACLETCRNFIDHVAIDDDVREMIINRIIDNASVAIAAANRRPFCLTLELWRFAIQEKVELTFLVFPNETFSPEWAAWANGTAVQSSIFMILLAADYSHPADNIPAILATAQTKGATGAELIEAIATGYEIQVNLVKRFHLHEWKKVVAPRYIQLPVVLELF